MSARPSVVVRDLGPAHRESFVARGHRARHFFPHRVLRLPKGGPDGLKLARRMCGRDAQPGDLWELVLYALPPARDEFPADVYNDSDIVWHQQQFGLPGHVATAALVRRGRDLVVLNLVSDLVQRIGRRRELKTRIENRFDGWGRLLLHAAIDFALDLGVDRVRVASADWALAHTDPARTVQRPLFDRVYDRSHGPPFHAVREAEEWWVLDVAQNAGAVVRPTPVGLPLADEPSVCVAHDIERGWGHIDEDPAFAAAVDAEARVHLTRMLDVEHDLGVRATYCVVGILVDELASNVRSAGHCVAFHSFDHAGAGDPSADDQLRRCRQVDYRIKGYRPAQSRITAELTDANLALHNFEWLASSRQSLGVERPHLADAVVHIPILFDDFALHNGTPYGEWEAAVLRAIEGTTIAAFSLHDCYGDHWLADYPDFLRKVSERGGFRTLDEVAAEVLLSRAV